MKTIRYLWVCLLSLCLMSASAQNSSEEGGKYRTISGIVKDKSSKKTLAYASVFISGSAEATITNADGEFTFKVKEPVESKEIEVSHLGYINTRIRLQKEAPESYTIWMMPSMRVLDEVIVSGREPRALVEEAVRKIASNYSAESNLLTGFYRETVRKRRRYINIAEAVVHVYKTPYTRNAQRDRVQILKGRRLLSPKVSDTLAVKLLGGPNAAIYLDVVKNPDLLLDPEVLPLYDFHLEEITFIDKRPQYVIRFSPNAILPYPLYYGKFYIDYERLSFTRAEFFLDVSNQDKAARTILRKKPRGLRFKPVEVAYVVNYVDYQDKTFLNYVRNEIRFKCDWRRKLFATSYSVVSEMVITDIEKATASIPFRESFGKNEVLSDNAALFFDEDFWGDYNIIKPEESLEKAVGKLKKKHIPD